MQITPSNLTSLFKGLKVKWQQGLTQYQAKRIWDYKDLSQDDPSSLAEEEIVWMDRVPRLKEWTTNKPIQNAFIRGFKAVNKKFADLHEFPMEDLERDEARRLASIMRQLIQAGANWRPFLVIDAIRNGGATFDPNFVGFDGVPTWSTLHPIDPLNPAKGQQSNLLTKMPLTDVNYQAARAAFMDFRGYDGETINVFPDLLMVPPELEADARKIVVARTNPTGADNVNYGTTKLMVVPELIPPDTKAGDPIRRTWYLWSTSLGTMPIITQVEKEPNFYASVPAMNGGLVDSEYVRTEKVYMDVQARGCAYVTAWFLTMKVLPV